MNVRVRAMGSLQARMPDRQVDATVSLPVGATVADMLARLGPDPSKVLFIHVNGEKVTSEHPLAEGDQIVLYPRIGGG